MEFMSVLYYNWDFFLLLFLRVSGLIFSSPIFGRRNIPTVAKIGYCACITYVFYLAVPQYQALDYNDDMFIYVLLCIKELLFGLVMGYVLNLFFTLTFTAGQMIDMQMGFGMVNIFDVQSNLSVPMTGNFLNIILLVTFFAVNGHRRLIEILYVSVVKIPVGDVVFDPSMGWVAAELFINAFLIAMMVAMPLIASGLLIQACLGILMKVVPQMNAFSIGLPMQVVIGFIVMSAFIPIYVNFTSYIFDQMFLGLDQMFTLMAGGG